MKKIIFLVKRVRKLQKNKIKHVDVDLLMKVEFFWLKAELPMNCLNVYSSHSATPLLETKLYKIFILKVNVKQSKILRIEGTNSGAVKLKSKFYSLQLNLIPCFCSGGSVKVFCLEKSPNPIHS